MMLKEQRHTSSAVAFEVDISDAKQAAGGAPEIKKKLESYSKAAQGPTLESISEKLKRAEEKRKLSLMSQNSPRIMERRQRAMEKKRESDAQLKHLQQKVERDLSEASEKRRATKEQRMQKLREHIAKVEEIRKEQAVRKKESTENLKQLIEQKLDSASQKRDE